MKYWLFDGKDVLGPFTLQTLAARTDFSATSLICAGETGEESDGWQLASSFEIFRFHPVSGQLEGVFLPDGKEVTATEIPTEEPQPKKTEEKPVIQPEPILVQPQPRVEKTVEEPATVILAREDVDLVLPEHPEENQASAPIQETTQSQEAAPQPQEPTQEQEIVPAQEPQNEQAEQDTSKPEKLQESLTVAPEEEIISTCTLPLVNEILERSDLPQLPQGDFEPVPLPDMPEFALKEIAAEPTEITAEQATTSVPTQTAAAPAQPVAKPVSQEELKPQEPQELVSSATEPTETPQETPAQEKILQEEPISQTAVPAPRPPREQTLHRLEQALANRQAVPDISERQSPTHKKAYMILWILLGIIIVLALAIWGLSRMKTQTTDTPSKAANTPTSVVQQVPTQTTPTPTPVATPVQTAALAETSAPEKPITPPKPVTAQEKALAAVQNYQLPDNKGTIAAYFDRVYQDHLSQGYIASWSVEPLHKSIYIVKYRLTKTRTEPIVYVFQADGVRGKLTGALNNIALDLVGRINQN